MTKSKYPIIIAIVGFSLLLFLAQSAREFLVFNRTSIDDGQWWRILTGNLTHSNYPHLLLNIGGLWILSFLFLDTLKTKTFIISVVLLCLIVGFGLYYFSPELHTYYGFSGTLYGLFFIAGISSTLQKDYFTGLSVMILIIGKVIWDYYKGGSTSSEELIGIPVATDAHLYGLVGAILIGSMLVLNHQITSKIKGNKKHPPTF